MKNKFIGLIILFVTACGLPSYGSDEGRVARVDSDERMLTISRDIIRLSATFLAVTYGDLCTYPILDFAETMGWIKDDVLERAMGEVCLACSDATSASFFKKVEKKHKRIEEAIKKIDVSSNEIPAQAVSEFLGLLRAILTDEKLNKTNPGIREYYLAQISALVVLFLDGASPNDKTLIVQSYEALQSAVVSLERQFLRAEHHSR